MAKRKRAAASSRGRRTTSAKATVVRRSATRRRKAAATTRRTGARKRHPRTLVAQAGGVTITEVAELDALRRDLERTAGRSRMRWNADPEEVQRSVAQLVLTLVEFVRKLLERQAIRRMEAGTLTDQQTEDIGRALMKLEETIVDMARRFGLSPEDLNLDLGPVGKLM